MSVFLVNELALGHHRYDSDLNDTPREVSINMRFLSSVGNWLSLLLAVTCSSSCEADDSSSLSARTVLEDVSLDDWSERSSLI